MLKYFAISCLALWSATEVSAANYLAQQGWQQSMAKRCVVQHQASLDPQVIVRAEAGDVTSSYQLGLALLMGKGMPRDQQQAIVWLQQAAEAGLAKAQYMLGFVYQRGESGQASIDQAIQWYKRAAKQGNASAQLALAKLQWQGLGLQQNRDESLEVLQHLSNEGMLEAQLALAHYYLEQVNQKPEAKRHAYQVLQQAKEQGSQQALLLQVLLQLEQQQSFTLTEADASILDKMANEGDEEAQFVLGLMYLHGVGLGLNPQLGMMLLQQAAESGHRSAQQALESLTLSS